MSNSSVEKFLTVARCWNGQRCRPHLLAFSNYCQPALTSKSADQEKGTRHKIGEGLKTKELENYS